MKKFIIVTFLGVFAILMASCGSSTSSKSQSDSQSQTQTQSDLQLPSFEDDGVSIFDSYSENQLKKLVQSDSKYANFYKRVYRTMSSKEWTKDQKNTFEDLTYRRLYHYQNLQKQIILIQQITILTTTRLNFEHLDCKHGMCRNR